MEATYCFNDAGTSNEERRLLFRLLLRAVLKRLLSHWNRSLLQVGLDVPIAWTAATYLYGFVSLLKRDD